MICQLSIACMYTIFIFYMKKMISVCNVQNNFNSFTCTDTRTLIWFNMHVIFLVQWRWYLYTKDTSDSVKATLVYLCRSCLLREWFFLYIFFGGGGCPNNCLLAHCLNVGFKLPEVRLCDLHATLTRQVNICQHRTIERLHNSSENQLLCMISKNPLSYSIFSSRIHF